MSEIITHRPEDWEHLEGYIRSQKGIDTFAAVSNSELSASPYTTFIRKAFHRTFLPAGDTVEQYRDAEAFTTGYAIGHKLLTEEVAQISSTEIHPKILYTINKWVEETVTDEIDDSRTDDIYSDSPIHFVRSWGEEGYDLYEGLIDFYESDVQQAFSTIIEQEIGRDGFGLSALAVSKMRLIANISPTLSVASEIDSAIDQLINDSYMEGI